MSKAGKVWGVTTTLLKKPNLHIEALIIEPGLLIEVHKNDYPLCDVTELLPGEFMMVKPGEFHRFVTETEGMTGIEVYWPEDLSDDIIRKDVGGTTK
jgi:hypothetical protein